MLRVRVSVCFHVTREKRRGREKKRLLQWPNTSGHSRTSGLGKLIASTLHRHCPTRPCVPGGCASVKYRHHHQPPSPLSRGYHYQRRTLGGDKSCDRNDSAKLLLARIRARSSQCVGRVAWWTLKPGGMKRGSEGGRRGSSARRVRDLSPPRRRRPRRPARPRRERQCPSRAVITHAFQ